MFMGFFVNLILIQCYERVIQKKTLRFMEIFRKTNVNSQFYILRKFISLIVYHFLSYLIISYLFY